jgi:hypothetical protein
MNRPLLIAAALLTPGMAFADTIDAAQGRLDLAGTAPSACAISTPRPAAGPNATFQSIGTQQGQVTITQFADPQSAVALGSTISLALPVICNAAHTVTVSTSNGGLVRLGGNARNVQTTNGFREFVPYGVSASWAGQTVSATSKAGATVTINSNDGAAGQLSLVISVPAGGDPLIAGTYNDQVVIELQAAS